MRAGVGDKFTNIRGSLITGLILALFAGGCSTMKPGSMASVQPVSAEPRAGEVYLLRGWIGFFSAGIDHLNDEINASGVRSRVFQDTQWSELASTIKAKYANRTTTEPLVLIGHSYGADDVIRIAQKLGDANINVDLLITLDPVTPPQVPKNVRVCMNYYQTNGLWDALPVLRGVPVSAVPGATVVVTNGNLRGNRSDLSAPGLDHFNIEKQPKVHVEIIKTVLDTCPARTVWAMDQQNIDPPAVPPRAVAVPVNSNGARVIVTDLSKPAASADATHTSTLAQAAPPPPAVPATPVIAPAPPSNH